MPTTKIAFAAALALAAGFALATRASAFELQTSAPQQACKPLAGDLSLPGLWLGHFTGGRLIRISGVDPILDWRDDYSCFTSRVACERWRRGLLRAYRSIEGYKTCLPLRGGGVRIERTSVTHVVIAKY